MRKKGVWGRHATQVDPRLSLGMFVIISITVIYFGSVNAQPESAESDENRGLSAECQSPLFQEVSAISVHMDDPLLVEHADLLQRCNAELNRSAERNANRMMARTIAPLEGLINFETPHVHPIDLTPDGNTLLAVNIAAHMLEVYQVSGSQLIHQQSIPVGIDPVSVRARTNTEAWVVNHVSDSVSIVDLTAGTVVRTLDTDNEPADVVFAGSPQRAFVSASEADAINVFNLSNLDASPQKINIFGEDPRALAVSNDGQTVYAAIFESGNNTRVQGSGSNATIARGNTLADNDVAVINANTLGLSFQTGLMTMNMALTVHPTNNNITVVGTESLNDILLEPNVNGIFSRVNLASFPQGGATQITDLNPHLTYSSPTVAQSVRDLSIGDPRGIAWRSGGNQAFVTGMGSNNVIVIDQVGNRVDNIEVGEGPTGIVLKNSANLGFVMNKFDGSISVINLNTRQQVSNVTFDDPTPDVIKNGRPFLYDTHETSGLGHVSCASCHVDSRTDRLAWDLGDPNGANTLVPEVSNSLPGALTGNLVSVSALKGPMVTQSLQDIMEHPVLHWRGDREDLDAFNPAFQGLMGDDEQLSSAEMQAFGDFLSTIWLQPNPYRNLDDTRPNSVTLPDGRTVTSATMDALRGNNPTNNNCLACHSGQGNATRNFGANAEIGSNIVAPALAGIYDKLGFGRGTAGFGFFHTGEANIDRASRLSTSEQNDAFLAELMTIGGPSGPLVGAELRQIPHAGVGQQLTINGSATAAQTNLLNQFKSISVNSSFAVLIAKANIGGTQRGFVYLGSDNFQTDRQSEQMTLAQLLTSATNGDPVTFTLVADGMETRLALDSDLDGTFNGDAALVITNPGAQTNTVGDTVDLTLERSGADPIVFNRSGLPPGLTMNSSGRITGSPTTAGSFNVLVWATDDNGSTDSVSFTWTIEGGVVTDCTPGILHEWWDGIPGLLITDLTSNASYPSQPTGSNMLDEFRIPANVKNNYGVRLRGFIVAPETGAYTFWIASDDQGELWLSTDDSPANVTRIAHVQTWTPGNDYDRFPAQKSAEINLISGQRYYVEALMKEWGGGDNLSVAWQTPSAARTVITDADLCALELTGSAPVADIVTDTDNGTTPLVVNFDATGSADSDGNIVSYQWTFGDGSSGSGATVSHTYANAGIFDVKLTVTDNDGRSDLATTVITANDVNAPCAQTGLIYDRFDNISGWTLPDLLNAPNYPDAPSSTQQLTDFQVPANVDDFYGGRAYGYIIPPVTGNYTFWIASDDRGSLRLSNDSFPENATEIALVPRWTPARQWDWYPEQQSAEISLVAGESYFVEAIFKEHGGGDNLAVAWQIPGGERQVVPSVVLCPFAENGSPPTASMSATPASGDAPLSVTFNGSASSDPDGPLASYTWEFGDGGTATGATPAPHVYTTAGTYEARLTVTDSDGRTDETTLTISVTTPGGGVACNNNGVRYERWNGVWTGNIANFILDPRYPDSPDVVNLQSNFVMPTNTGDIYGSRMRGYLIAPETGLYTFWVANDNEGQLWLSTDTLASNATQIIQTLWSPEQNWDYSASQKSAEILLTADQAYYIEGLHQTNWAGDYYAVAWQMPSGSRELIPNNVLCEFEGAGRAAGTQSVESGHYAIPSFGASQILSTLPVALHPEAIMILTADQSLRAELFALRAEFEQMLVEDAGISADFLADLTAAYHAVYAQASPDLQTWLASHWSRINSHTVTSLTARDVWAVANTLAPTSTQLHSQQVSEPSAVGQVLLVVLGLLFVTVWVRRRFSA